MISALIVNRGKSLERVLLWLSVMPFRRGEFAKLGFRRNRLTQTGEQTLIPRARFAAMQIVQHVGGMGVPTKELCNG